MWLKAIDVINFNETTASQTTHNCAIFSENRKIEKLTRDTFTSRSKLGITQREGQSERVEHALQFATSSSTTIKPFRHLHFVHNLIGGNRCFEQNKAIHNENVCCERANLISRDRIERNQMQIIKRKSEICFSYLKYRSCVCCWQEKNTFFPLLLPFSLVCASKGIIPIHWANVVLFFLFCHSVTVVDTLRSHK